MYTRLILRPTYNNGPVIGQSLEIRLHSSNNRSGQDSRRIDRKLQYILTHLIIQEGSIGILLHLGHPLDGQHIGVEDGQLFLQLHGDWHVGFLYVLVRVEQELVGVLVVAVLLFLGGDCYGDFCCVSVVF